MEIISKIFSRFSKQKTEPTTASAAKETKLSEFEKKLDKLQQSILEALRTGQKINIRYLLYDDGSFQPNLPLGDSIILTSTLYQMIRVLANTHGISNPIHLTMKENEGVDLGFEIESLSFEIKQANRTQKKESVLASSAFTYSQLLGLTEEAEQVQHKATLLVPIEGHQALEDFNYQTAVERSEEIKEELQLGKQPLILICQAGSGKHKRFSDEQTERLQQLAEERYPEGKVVILKDSAIRNLTDLVGYLLLSDLTITTDTSWSWIASSVNEYLRPDSPALTTVLHTISSDFWHPPQTESVYGGATKILGEELSRDGLLSGVQYSLYADGLDMLDYSAKDRDREPPPITQNDFNLLVQHLDSQLPNTL